MKRAFPFVLLSAYFAVGCDSVSSEVDAATRAPDGGAFDATSSATESDAATSQDAAERGDAHVALDAAPDAARNDRNDAGSPDAGSRDRRLYPLAIGRTWTYQVQSTYPFCASGERTMAVLDSASVPRGEGFVLRSHCGFESVVLVDGDITESQNTTGSGGWFRMTDEPTLNGHSWDTSNGQASFSMTYEELGRVETPAGAFDECWRVTQNVSYTMQWVYCRGVGMVSTNLVDLGGGYIRAELIDTNF